MFVKLHMSVKLFLKIFCLPKIRGGGAGAPSLGFAPTAAADAAAAADNDDEMITVMQIR